MHILKTFDYACELDIAYNDDYRIGSSVNQNQANDPRACRTCIYISNQFVQGRHQ